MMALNLKKIKVKANKNKIKDAPNFLIAYDQMGNDEKKKLESYQIISALVQDKDIFVEIKSELMSVTKGIREDFFMDFLKTVKNFGLIYRYKKLPPSQRSFLSLDFLSKPRDNHEALIYIPNEIWKKEEISKLLPTYGLKYYICKNNVEGEKLLDSLNNGQMLPEEINETFSIIIFDCTALGQMGIYTEQSTLDEINNMLASSK
jgi:hypothetical protein